MGSRCLELDTGREEQKQRIIVLWWKCAVNNEKVSCYYKTTNDL